MSLEHFKNLQRVKVANPDHPCVGKVGTVVRKRIADNGAWVNMHDDLPDDLRSFPADDRAGRGNHIILYPEECEDDS